MESAGRYELLAIGKGAAVGSTVVIWVRERERVGRSVKSSLLSVSFVVVVWVSKSSSSVSCVKERGFGRRGASWKACVSRAVSAA